MSVMIGRIGSGAKSSITEDAARRMSASNEWEIRRDLVKENRGIKPIFFLQQQDVFDEAGRHTGSVEIECVKLIIAGDDLTRPILPVDDAIRERFADAYQAFLEEREAGNTGTPLTALEGFPSEWVENLASYEIHSVEELSALSDANLHIQLGLRYWRDKAVEYLKGGPDRERVEKVEAENAALKERLLRLEAKFKKPARRKLPGKVSRQPDAPARRLTIARSSAPGRLLPRVTHERPRRCAYRECGC